MIKKIGAGFSRVPIVGSLIVAVSSLLAGEPLGQAAFKGLGSAIGGFAGSFIPIPPPIGTLIGSTIGTFIGDVLYSLFLGGGPAEAGEKFKKGITDAFKMIFDFGGMLHLLNKDLKDLSIISLRQIYLIYHFSQEHLDLLLTCSDLRD